MVSKFHKITLTLEDIENNPPETVLYKEKTIDSCRGVNINNTGEMLKLVIKTGHNKDWTAYFGYDENMSYEGVENVGDKVFYMLLENILIADQEVWNRYRI